MSADYFVASCHWTGRGENTREFGEKVLLTFDAVSRLTPKCKNWEVADWRREAMVPLDSHRADMTALVEQGVAHDDDGDPAPVYGYSLSGVTDFTDPNEDISIDFRGAQQSRTLTYGSVVFSTRDPATKNYPLMHAILLAFIEIWKPDIGFADAGALVPFRREPRRTLDVAWMTYLPPSFARRAKSLGSVTTELVEGGGLLLIATQEAFDAANPAHLAGAYALRDVVAPLNTSLPPPWNR